MVAVQAVAAEEWRGIPVMLVVGHGSVFQKLGLEKLYHPHYLSHKTLFCTAFHSFSSTNNSKTTGTSTAH